VLFDSSKLIKDPGEFVEREPNSELDSELVVENPKMLPLASILLKSKLQLEYHFELKIQFTNFIRQEYFGRNTKRYCQKI